MAKRKKDGQSSLKDLQASLQAEVDKFSVNEWPKIEAFRIQVEKSMKSLREGKISQKDFYEELMKDSEPVSTMAYLEFGAGDFGEWIDVERTVDGKLVLKSQQISWTIPSLKACVGLDDKGQLIVKELEAWFTDEETGKTDQVKEDTIYSDFNLEPMSVKGLAEELLQSFLNCLRFEGITKK